MSSTEKDIESLAEQAVKSTSRLDALNSFTAQEVERFFDHLPKARSQAIDDGRNPEEVHHCIRQSMGLWYATVFLSSMPLDGSEELTVRNRLRRLAEEALRWHEDSFLSHVVVFIREDEVDTIQHYCAVVRPSDQSISTTVYTFLGALQEYIRDYGSTVRTAEHLRWSGHVEPRDQPCAEENTPVSPRAFEEMDPQHFTIRLPDDHTKFGDNPAYLKVVHDSFASHHPPIPSDAYEALQLAGGSDTRYKMKGSLGAVAHLYIVFRRSKVNVSGVFIQTMRAMLSRLAMCYALEQLNAARDEASRARDEAQEFSKLLRDRVRALDSAIGEVERANKRVRSLTFDKTWERVTNWTKTLHDLQSNMKAKCQVGSLDLTPDHDTWPTHYFQAVFLEYLDDGLLSDVHSEGDIEATWTRFIDSLFTDTILKNPRFKAAYRMGLLCMSGLTTLDPSLVPENGGRVDISWFKGVFCKRYEDDYDARYNTTVGLLAFCLGVRVYADECRAMRKIPKVMLGISKVDVNTMIEGLRRLLDALLDPLIPSGDEHSFFGYRASHSAGQYVGTTFRVESSSLITRLSPVHYCPGVAGADRDVRLIDRSGVAALLTRLAELIKKPYPHAGFEDNNASLAVFSALGITVANWALAQQQLRICATEVSLPPTGTRFHWDDEQQAFLFTCSIKRSEGLNGDS